LASSSVFPRPSLNLRTPTIQRQVPHHHLQSLAVLVASGLSGTYDEALAFATALIIY
jgi:hypothetical protein